LAVCFANAQIRRRMNAKLDEIAQPLGGGGDECPCASRRNRHHVHWCLNTPRLSCIPALSLNCGN
jgi:hypothetical protein